MIENSSPNPHCCDEDVLFVRAAKNGDVSAFEALVKKYERKLFRIVRNVVHNTEDAEDAVQNAFFKAYQNLKQFQENAKFSTWLIRIALNESFMAMRKKRSMREQSLAGDFTSEADGSDTSLIPVDVPDWVPDPESLYGAAEFRKILTSCLNKLSPALKIVFLLRDVEGCSIIETAAILNLTANAVKSRLARSRFQLREDLSQYFSVRSFAARTSNGQGQMTI